MTATLPDRDGYESARMYSIERKAREHNISEPEAARVIAAAERVQAAKAAATPYPPSACDALGHEYNFGICLDCGRQQPDYEPTDAQIPGTYEIGKAAA